MDRGVVHAAVEPHVVGLEVFIISEVALDGFECGALFAVALGVIFFVEADAVFGAPGRSPVPIDHCCHATARNRRNVTGLAGDTIGVVVELHCGEGLELVRPGAVAALARCHIAPFTGLAGADRVLRHHVVAATGDDVLIGDVTFGARKVQALGVHVHIELLARLDERRIQIAMLDAIAAAAIEVAATAILSSGQADALGDFDIVNKRLVLEHDRASLAALCVRRLVIGARAIMANEAVNVLLVGEIEVLVLPAVPCMALRAHAFVAARIGAEVVDQMFLAEFLAIF